MVTPLQTPDIVQFGGGLLLIVFLYNRLND
jgi:hypothetical protein